MPNSRRAMFIAVCSEAPGAEPGFASLATAIGTPCARKCIDRWQPRIGEGVIRDGQQHGDGAGPRQLDRVVLDRVLEVIAGERAVSRSHAAAADVADLFGMQSHRPAVRLRCGEEPVALRPR